MVDMVMARQEKSSANGGDGESRAQSQTSGAPGEELHHSAKLLETVDVEYVEDVRA